MWYERSFDAFVDNGVLRPLTPIDLPDQVGDGNWCWSLPTARRRRLLASCNQRTLRELKAVPQAKDEDGWSAANHDDLLYGPKQ